MGTPCDIQSECIEPRRFVRRGFLHGVQAGFTLIELITVMVIVGVMAVAVLPRMTDFSWFAQRGVYDQARSALRYARGMAIAQRRWVQVTDQGGGLMLSACNGLGSDGCDADTAACTLPVLDPATGQSLSVAGITHDSGYSGQFYFDCEGRPRSVAGTITYTVPGGYSFQVEPETGYVHP
jgi:MSHA pilin protein MshC